MDRLFEEITLGSARLLNRFVFPPIKLGYGNPDGTVTDRQLLFYRQIADKGPAAIILEPVSVTPGGREHPKQPFIHLPGSSLELKKIVDVIHQQNRLACLHLNHAGAAANPMATKTKPRAPSLVTCPTSGQQSESLSEEDIKVIIGGYRSAAAKAVEAGFDMIEIQAGHGYLVSQFLNAKINKREDSYDGDRSLFAAKVLSAVNDGAAGLPVIVRISGNEMAPGFGVSREDLLPLLRLAEKNGVAALHVGMGNACFSPPWYFHHGSLPLSPQLDALSWLREQTSLPLIAAGRMGSRERIQEFMSKGLADCIALGRPLLADPHLIEKWRRQADEDILPCGYCLQGCLHRVKSGEPLGCNLNPEIGMPPLERTGHPEKVLVAGGGPAGMSAALYLSRRGHQVTLAEKTGNLGGQFALAWQAPGKEGMRAGLEGLQHSVANEVGSIYLDSVVDEAFVRKIRPTLLVWATGAVQNVPRISGLEDQYVMTAIEYFKGEKEVHGPRILVVGAGRTGVEIAEKLGKGGYEVLATKRTDPIGSMMEMVTRNLALKRIEQMPRVTLMPHTRVVAFHSGTVEIEQDGVFMSVEPFQTVIVAAGMLPGPEPNEKIRESVPGIMTIGDAAEVQDIFSAMHAGYRLARSC